MKKQITNIDKIIKLLQGEYDLSKMRDYCIDEINRKIREYMKSKKSSLYGCRRQIIRYNIEIL